MSQNKSFSTTQYAKVGQLKVNNKQVMCHLFKMLSDTSGQNPLVLLTKLGKNSFRLKTLSQMDLESKGQDHSKNQKPMPQGTKIMPPQKNLSRCSPSNWCDADLDADISKTICRPPPYRGSAYFWSLVI